MKKVSPQVISVVSSILIFATAALVTILFKVLTWEVALAAFGIEVVACLTGVLTYIFSSRNRDDEIRRKDVEFQGEFEKLLILTRSREDEKQAGVEKLIKKLDEFNNAGNSLDHYIDRMKQILKGTIGESVIGYKELLQIESTVNDKSEIWIMTSALKLETDDEMKKIIRANLIRGVIYKYLIPEENISLQDKMEDLAKSWKGDCKLSEKDAQSQIQCYLVPQHIVHLTIAIYNARSNNSTPIVIIKLPTTDVYTKEEFPIVLRVVDKPGEIKTEPFTNAFLELIVSAKEPHKFCARVRPKVDIF